MGPIRGSGMERTYVRSTPRQNLTGFSILHRPCDPNWLHDQRPDGPHERIESVRRLTLARHPPVNRLISKSHGGDMKTASPEDVLQKHRASLTALALPKPVRKSTNGCEQPQTDAKCGPTLRAGRTRVSAFCLGFRAVR